MTPLAERPPAETHIMVGMSGGVDSSLTAARLLAQGYQVSGLFMKNWEEDDGTEYCTAMRDLADAQAVADRLGIPLHTVNFAAEYWDQVFEYFLAEYAAGRTPNPDILCNREIKFKAFLDYALSLGADGIATGHYARTRPDTDHAQRACLLRGIDASKDQSYFLHAVGGDKLALTLFPVGELHKVAVREAATRWQLATATKKDSTGICFIGERRFADFLQRYLPAQPGDIVDEAGRLLGSHQGLMYHTIGQRGGLGLGGVRGQPEGAWFVLGKNLATNQLIVGQGHDHPALLSQSLISEPMQWIAGQPPQALSAGQTWYGQAQVRYRQQPENCAVTLLPEGRIQVQFERPQRAITPGQSVVLYADELCLGGTPISASDASYDAVWPQLHASICASPQAV